MPRPRLSSKGQVVIPRDIRDRHGWGAGALLEVEDRGGAVVLRTVSRVPKTRIEDVLGCVPYHGPPVSIEEMDAAVSEEARRMWEDFEQQRRS